MKKIKLVFFLLLFNIPVFSQNSPIQFLKRNIKINKGQKYLCLPVNNNDGSVLTTVSYKDSPIDQFRINLAVSKPEFWTFLDISQYQGKVLTIKVENAPMPFQNKSEVKENNTNWPNIRRDGLEMIFSGSTFPAEDSLYMERDRPQVHFSAGRGWINDPNGLVYYKGEYHLYFQHNPYGWQWGNMHWGHAVSNDLIHWQQLKEAIYPIITMDSSGRWDAAFSGSAVVDPSNTSGFKKNGIDPIIAIYTSTGRGECLRMSYDSGRTFIDYEGNPILKHNGRDPKVFWYEPGKYWVMVVWDAGIPKTINSGVEVSVQQNSIYTSSDLKHWTYQSGVPGFFECPELFELPLEGEPGVSKWLMYDASGRYVVGDFNGKEFKIEQNFTRYEHGGGYFYASQTFNNVPNGRRVQIGWGRNITQPGMPFNQPELLPTELKLKKTQNGYRLCPTPIEQINLLKKNSQELENQVIQTGEKKSLPVNEDIPLHIIAEFERGDAPMSLNIMGYNLSYDNEWIFTATPPEGKNERQETPAGPFPPPSASTPVNYTSNSNVFKIEAIVDKNILEFFINDGELYYVTAFNGKKIPTIEVSVADGARQRRGIVRKFVLKKLEVDELNSIWNR